MTDAGNRPVNKGAIHGRTSPGTVRRAEHELIREALQRAVERGSLRAVAKEVGMSPTGLQGFLDGAEPYFKTVEKIRIWYALRSADRGSELGSDTAVALVDTLLGEIPASRRAGARERVLRAFADAFEAADVAPPAWTDVARS
jgi:hypothetical protein